MAFALPSFNAAVASGQTSGQPLQRLQSNINFNDVKSTMGIQTMVQAPFTQFAMESAMARDALGQMAQNFRQKRDLDTAMELAEMRIDADKKARLTNQLMGGGSKRQSSSMLSPLEQQIAYRQGVNTLNQLDAAEIGGLNPMLSLGEYVKNIPTSGMVNTGSSSVPAAQQPKVEETPQAKSTKWDELSKMLESITIL